MEEERQGKGTEMKKNEEKEEWSGTDDANVSLYILTYVPVMLDTPPYTAQ